MNTVTMYARDSNNKIKQWSVKTNDNVLIISYGKLDGSIINRATSILGKNIGRSNETTSDEQAVLIANSKIAKHKKDGYKTLDELGITNVDKLDEILPKFNTDDKGNIKPMKAQWFKPGVMSYPVYGQPKINGLRSISNSCEISYNDNKVVIKSKNGLIYGLPHIERVLGEYYQHNPHCQHIRFDGELYIHGESLNNIKSCIPMQQNNGTFSKPSGNPLSVQLWIYDLAISNVTQKERFNLLARAKLYLHDMNTSLAITPISILPIYTITSDTMAETFTDLMITKGFEGAIFRDKDAMYKFGIKASTMRKYKRVKHTECEVLDVIDKGVKSGILSIALLLKNDINDEQFECTPGSDGMWTEAQKYLLVVNKTEAIGKLATVRYYERSGKKEVPFHANVETIRDYE